MDQYLGEIRMFAGNFAPNGWALCNGQILPLAQNTALFSLLGTNFGGNGSTTFGLPNLQGSAPMHAGNGPGLSPRDIGEVGGSATVTINTTAMAAHTHSYSGVNANPLVGTPAGNLPAINRTLQVYTAPGDSGLQTAAMSAQSTGATGGNQPHNNMQPYLAVTFIIALVGVYPQRP